MLILESTMDLDPSYILFSHSKRAFSGWSLSNYTNAEFEESYNASLAALDYDQRRAYVDDCQRIYYADAASLILAYPYQTYVWRTDIVGEDDWGNWSAQPGRSLDNVWGAHPLLLREPSESDKIILSTLEKVLIGVIVIVAVAIVAVLVLKKRKMRYPR